MPSFEQAQVPVRWVHCGHLGPPTRPAECGLSGQGVLRHVAATEALFRAVLDRAVRDRAVLDRAVLHRAVVDRAVRDRAVVDRAVVDREKVGAEGPVGPGPAPGSA